MAKRSNLNTIIMGLDVGAVRIGVAVASSIARLPRPIAIISHDDHVFTVIGDLAQSEQADLLVVGLPRNMDGQETAQTLDIRQFAERLQTLTGLKIVFADESLSSQRAEEAAHGYRTTSKGKHLDDIAACLILEEFFNQESELQP